MWCTSVNSVCVQPGNRHPLSRRLISSRWGSLGSRRVRPRLRLRPSVPSAETRTWRRTRACGRLLGTTGPRTSSSAPPSPPARKFKSACTTTVGRLRRAPPACAGPVATLRGFPGRRRRSADGDEGIGHPLIERRSVTTAATGPRTRELLDDGVLVLGQRSAQGSTSIVEAEEPPGVKAGRPFVGLVPRGQRELADLLRRPACRLFGQLGIRFGLGHFDEWLDLVEGELSLRQGIGDLGQGRELGSRRDPFAAVAAETLHRWTSQATMEVAPSTRQARRRSSSATAARSWLWCAEMAR